MALLGARQRLEPLRNFLEALAKHYEHRERNYAMALEMTRTALEFFAAELNTAD